MIYPHTVEIVSDNETADAFTDSGVLTETGRVTSLAYMQPPTLGQLAGAVVVGRDVGVEDWVVFLPPDVALDENDRIEWEGQVFEVRGLPSVHQTPRGDHHMEARLRPAV